MEKEMNNLLKILSFLHCTDTVILHQMTACIGFQSLFFCSIVLSLHQYTVLYHEVLRWPLVASKRLPHYCLSMFVFAIYPVYFHIKFQISLSIHPPPRPTPLHKTFQKPVFYFYCYYIEQIRELRLYNFDVFNIYLIFFNFSHNVNVLCISIAHLL